MCSLSSDSSTDRPIDGHAYRYILRYKGIYMCTDSLLSVYMHTQSYNLKILELNYFFPGYCHPFYSGNLFCQVAICSFLKTSLYEELTMGQGGPSHWDTCDCQRTLSLTQRNSASSNSCQLLLACPFQQNPGEPLSFLFMFHRESDISTTSTLLSVELL